MRPDVPTPTILAEIYRIAPDDWRTLFRPRLFNHLFLPLRVSVRNEQYFYILQALGAVTPPETWEMAEHCYAGRAHA